MHRFKNAVADGTAPNGRWYASDLDQLQDLVAALEDFTQVIGLGTLQIGLANLQLLRYGAGVTQSSEGRLTGDFRADGIVRGLLGLMAGSFSTLQRDALPAGHAPTALIIYNTTTNRYEVNSGTDGSRTWVPLGGTVAQEVRGLVNADGTIPTGWTGYAVTPHGSGSYDVTFTNSFSVAPLIQAYGYGGNVGVSSRSTGGFHADTQGAANSEWNFIAKGQ